jgi:adenylate kinase
MLGRTLGFRSVASGDLLREQIAAGTAIGRVISAYVERGDLVPSELTCALVARTVHNGLRESPLIFDGFPRTLHEALALEEVLASADRATDLALRLAAPTEVLIERMLRRGRVDDNTETIRRRLVNFGVPPGDLVAHYRDRGLLHEVDADRGADEVAAHIFGLVHTASPHTGGPGSGAIPI